MKPFTKLWALVFIFWVLILAPACTSNEFGNSKNVAQDKI
jgi:hypothetical protein